MGAGDVLQQLIDKYGAIAVLLGAIALEFCLDILKDFISDDLQQKYERWKYDRNTNDDKRVSDRRVRIRVIHSSELIPSVYPVSVIDGEIGGEGEQEEK